MNSIKKMCSILLVAAVIAGTGVFASAAEISESVIFNLKSLQIVQGDENGELYLEEKVTRAEFISMMARMLQIQDLHASAGRTDFRDVNSDDWFYDAVYWMADSGILRGYGDGTFRPNAPVSANEAVKILITVLGYGDAAEEAGGYPQGYLSIANKSRLTRGVDTGNSFCRADAMVLIDNSLDVYINELGKDVPTLNHRETFRDRLMGSNKSESIYEIKGIVQANASAWIVPGDYNLKDDQIIIDGLLYQTEVPNAADYLGKQVECYVAVEDDVRTLLSIRETKKNRVIEITDEDFVSADTGSITYRQDDKDERAELSDTAVLLKNMRIAEQWSARDINLTQGSITLIDNDGDDAYDVIHIQEFESYLISDLRADVIYFKLHEDNQNKKVINFASNNHVNYIIADSEGKLLEVSDLQKDMVVSIMESGDGNVCKIITGQPSFTAVLEMADADSLYFDGKEYYTEHAFCDKYRLGDTYHVYLNFRGEIYMIDTSEESDSGLHYGYIAELQSKGSLVSGVKALVIEPGAFVEVEEKSEVEDDDTVLRKLKGQNKSVKEFVFADNVKVDGKRMNSQELLHYFNQSGTRSNRVVQYRVNSDGKISNIEIPQICGRELSSREEQRIYNAQEKIFGGMLVGAFGATEATKVLVIPDYAGQGSVSQEDYQAVVEINDGQAYTVNGYDVGERECVDLITIMTTMQYDASSAILDTDKMALLEKSITRIDENGDTAVQLQFWSDGKAMSYVADDKVRLTAEQLKSGDIFYYAISPSSNMINKIIRIDNVVEPDRGQGQFGQPGDSNPEGLGQITAGTVSDILYEQIIDISNRRKDCIQVNLGNGEMAEIRINSRNAPAMYLYSKRKNTAKPITSRDIIPDDGTIVIHVKNNAVRGVVVVQ